MFKIKKPERLTTEEIHDGASYLNETTQEFKIDMKYNGVHSDILDKMEDIIDLFNEIENLILHGDEEE